METYRAKRKTLKVGKVMYFIVIGLVFYSVQYSTSKIFMYIVGIQAAAMLSSRTLFNKSGLTITDNILTLKMLFTTKEINLNDYYEFNIVNETTGYSYIYAYSKDNYDKEKVKLVLDVYKKPLDNILNAIKKAASNELSSDTVWDF